MHMTKFKCNKCGFAADITSDHTLTKCPACSKSFGETLKAIGDYLSKSEPVTIYREERYELEGADEINAAANFKRAQAELLRAQHKQPELQGEVHQHIHIQAKQHKSY
jgi:hypothetical protein